ncbi:MAG: DUF5615 family PIN-like protein [Alphaproteobacteria bacterium]
MRILVDAQLPPALARWLTEMGHEAFHVGDMGLLAASDREIWSEAAKRDAVLVTKDRDFIVLKNLEPDGPAIVWLRIGNTTKQALLEHMQGVLPAILAALASGEQIIEIQ